MKRRAGFTIVELLIVIVVIAILAAITIVAFNGVTTRAENTKTQQAVAGYAKLLHMYVVDNGAYPTSPSCLGNTPGCLSSTSAVCFGAGAASLLTLNTSLAPYVTGGFPQPSTQKLSCGGATYSGAYYYYDTTNNVGKIIAIYGVAPARCPAASGLTVAAPVTSEQATRCTYTAPSI